MQHDFIELFASIIYYMFLPKITRANACLKWYLKQKILTLKTSVWLGTRKIVNARPPDFSYFPGTRSAWDVLRFKHGEWRHGSQVLFAWWEGGSYKKMQQNIRHLRQWRFCTHFPKSRFFRILFCTPYCFCLRFFTMFCDVVYAWTLHVSTSSRNKHRQWCYDIALKHQFLFMEVVWQKHFSDFFAWMNTVSNVFGVRYVWDHNSEMGMYLSLSRDDTDV